MKIEIAIDASKKEIVIKDDAGNERSVNSIVICGGDGVSGKLYLFGWGSSADAGWALANSLKTTDDPFYKKVFDYFFRFIGLGKEKQEVDPENVLERWEAEDKKDVPTYN